MRYIILLLVLVLCGFFACEALQRLEPELEVDAPTDVEANTEEEPPQLTEEREENPALLLKEFFDKKNSMTYFVEYSLNSQSGNYQQKGTMRQHIETQEKMRIDMVSQGVETRTYIEDISYTTCTNAQNTWHCFETRSDPTQDVLPSEVETNPEKYDVTILEAKQLAGVWTTCFSVDIEDARVQYCFSEEGIPLLLETQGVVEGQHITYTLEATSYSTQLEEDVFFIPAPAAKYL